MTGGHWAVLQSIAWARMISQYAQQESLGGALAKTFDGNHPCPMCRAIQQGQQQERQQHRNQARLNIVQRPDLLCDLRQTLIPSRSLASMPAVPFVPGWRPDFVPGPLKPPPRLAAAA